jgi:hypothetical protein
MADEPGMVPENEVQDQPQVETSRAQATEIKPPGARRRLSYSLFSRETRSGRFFRGLLRWLVVTVLLLAAGFFLAFYLLYRPAELSLNQVRARATESAVDLQRAQQELEDARSGLTSAQEGQQAAQDQLGLEQARVQILRAVVSLRTAQTAAVSDDPTTAEEHIAQAQETLQQSQARLDRIDPDASSNIQALFTLVRNGLDRDPEVAGQDLERLIVELERLESELE